VGVTVDKSGANHVPFGINRLPRLAVESSNGGYFAVLNRNVCSVTG
jgi:hypothetical protein